MEKESKRFEDWKEVDCNECERWWLNQCDGASKGSKVGCNSFLATRKVVLPARLNELERAIKWLTILVSILLGWNIGQLIAYLLRWF